MGTTVNYSALISAIGRELGKQVEVKQAVSTAAQAKADDAVALAAWLTLKLTESDATDETKNSVANVLYQYGQQVAVEAARLIEANAAAVVELQGQIAAAAVISPEALSADADGNVDFDVAQAAIIAGLNNDEQTMMTAANKGLSDAQQRAITLQSLREMTAAFRPEMI